MLKYFQNYNIIKTCFFRIALCNHEGDILITLFGYCISFDDGYNTITVVSILLSWHILYSSVIVRLKAYENCIYCLMHIDEVVMK